MTNEEIDAAVSQITKKLADDVDAIPDMLVVTIALALVADALKNLNSITVAAGDIAMALDAIAESQQMIASAMSTTLHRSDRP